MNSFYISTHEVTNEEFAEFITTTGYITTAERYHNAMNFYVGLGEYEWKEDSTACWKFPFGTRNPGIESKHDHPVTCISFEDALAYCAWKGERLPTLDEWEIASRCANKDRYFWGKDSGEITTYANIWINPDHRDTLLHDPWLFTAPVMSQKPNPWGLHDMYGNVFEFCADLPPAFPKAGQLAAARGGSWWCSTNSCNYFNSVDIGRVNRYASFPNHGFRTVKE